MLPPNKTGSDANSSLQRSARRSFGVSFAKIRISPTSGAAVRSIAIAGGIVATIGVDGAARAGPVTSWPAGGPLPVVAGGDGKVVLQAQPSPSGRELAIVVADLDGDAASIRILAAAEGWHEIARFGLPSGANRAVVSWLAAW